MCAIITSKEIREFSKLTFSNTIIKGQIGTKFLLSARLKIVHFNIYFACFQVFSTCLSLPPRNIICLHPCFIHFVKWLLYNNFWFSTIASREKIDVFYIVFLFNCSSWSSIHLLTFWGLFFPKGLPFHDQTEKIYIQKSNLISKIWFFLGHNKRVFFQGIFKLRFKMVDSGIPLLWKHTPFYVPHMPVLNCSPSNNCPFPFQALKCPSYQGGDSDTLGHNNPRGQVHFQEREENELSMARLFLETGVWAFEDMSVGDVFLGSRTWEMGKSGVGWWRITVRGVCFLFCFLRLFSALFLLSILFIYSLCWAALGLPCCMQASASCGDGVPLWLRCAGFSVVASLVAEHGRCGTGVSAAAAPGL